MAKGKTKADLLRAMVRKDACGSAAMYVQSHRSRSALTIGLECDRPEWLMWLLYRVLTRAGLDLLAQRLDTDDDGLWRLGVVDHEADECDRRVINDCWRAWCRSGKASP